MNRGKKIFVFGLDGATWKLIDRWVKRGYLPFFEKLIRQGVRRDLISTIPPRSAPAWASFISGLTPAEHGVYDFLVKKDPFAGNEGNLVNGSWLGKNKFWRLWQQTGKKIALINLPLGYPVEKVNGVLSSSFLTPPDAEYVYPPKMASRLEEWGLGRDKIGFLEDYMNKSDNREIFNLVKQQLGARFQGAKKLVEENDFDFFFLYCRETDIIQHLFWRGRQTIEIYRRLDKLLSDFYEFLGKKYGKRSFYFFLISDHGFHPSPKIQVNLYPWLRKSGFLSSPPKVFLARALRKLSFWEKDKSKSRFNYWGESSLLKVDIFGIWLNKKALGKNYHQYREKLIDELRQLKFGQKRVFQLVAKREEVYPKAGRGKIWDIIWLTRPYFVIGPCSIERKIFISASNKIRDRLPGWHDSDRVGIFLAKGVGIKKLLKDWQENDLYIWDLPKIFNRIFGLPDDKIKKRTGNQKRTKLTKKEEAEIKKRLGALGYL